MDLRVYVHRIDKDDNIVFVDDDWLAFAVENDTPEITREAVLGRPLWDFIEDAETRHVYRLLLGRIRDEKAAITIPFRCDSPDRIRRMEMDILPLLYDSVQFNCRLLEEAGREPVRLLDPALARSGGLLAVCSWCRKARLEPERWVEIEEAVKELDLMGEKRPPLVTHGVCPACNSIVFKKR